MFLAGAFGYSRNHTDTDRRHPGGFGESLRDQWREGARREEGVGKLFISPLQHPWLRVVGKLFISRTAVSVAVRVVISPPQHPWL